MILVRGATGHVGRAVVSGLASLGHDVVAMVRDVQAASRRLPSGAFASVAPRRSRADNIGSGSWPCDNAPEGVSAGRDRRDALQGDRFEHIFPISVWEATWFIIGPS